MTPQLRLTLGPTAQGRTVDEIQPEVAALVGKIRFDPNAVHTKYPGERDKHLRDDGIDQYVEVRAEFSRYAESPHVEPGFAHAPAFDEVQFAIIGGGFGGLRLSPENQTRHVTIVSQARERGSKTFALTREAESAYVQEVRRLSGISDSFYRERTPGCYNSEGAAGNRTTSSRSRTADLLQHAREVAGRRAPGRARLSLELRRAAECAC